ncbi:formyl-coenzyme A transferase [Variibacter gotjawalensis]|uniref:Formyl-coenzyme A transferase n=1 Tax=Variibacter gotjawalensis TaxID=1333996 RepID=A0A0S3Q042_9BRAD|nr:CoA transferase [Variibacter gotjawalensis]NIK47182.1 crotonobetainyl-CoA:carnitine CoA-transferase CaiB-like acyl-CoA transferase [Variibacter gotjawalensis]RZS49082.1 crotonobetainyl-CoA:carnitine CoA-transferase CaiB-like acyl-CoA transferase [Variibacter gotjawalensis]BAT61344.1 formyl-coenzyme A transferase [Variibacter gotjawalensis]
MTSKTGPLAGIRIVDMTAVVMGPYAMQIMADYGADVIKIEGPDGDIMRYAHMNGDRGMGPVHLAMNRGKRLVNFDLKKEEAREVLRKIIASADAFVHALRPQAIERLGFGYEDVRKINPNIVYVGGYGFAADGPYGDQPAYDDMIQSICGISGIASHMVGEPRYFPTIVADKVCGLNIAQALLAALLHKQRTGEGQKVEVPMFETMVSFLMVEHLCDRTFGPDKSPGYSRVLSQVRRPHKTMNGYIGVLPYNDKHWRQFFAVVGHPEMANDPRFATYHARSANYNELYGKLREFLIQNTTEHWLEKLREAQIPAAPVLNLEQLFDDEHLNAVGLFQHVDHPVMGDILAVRPPVSFSETPARMGKPAGVLGADTTAVLEDFGYSSAEIEKLKQSGAVIQG